MAKDIPQFTLNDELAVPATGIGTYGLWGNAGADSIQTAIDAGYRLIDTAYNYENEGAVGEGIKRSGVSRDELLITSKLPGRYHQAEKAAVAIEESLYRAKLDYFDSYIIHWPNPKQELYVDAWQALIEAKKQGLIRSIGVSNFLPEHIEQLEKETGVKPSINQIELHPFFNQQEQLRWHKEQGIQTESWSPLARAAEVLTNETLSTLAKTHNKTVAQIVLRWHYQLGSVSIPRSTSAERQKENISIFDFSLSDVDMSEIASLTRPDGRMNDQDPAVYEEF